MNADRPRAPATSEVLSMTGAQELMDSNSGAHLAYTAKDGTSRVVPVGNYWTGEEFGVATHPYAPKLAALAAHPDVALAIDGSLDPDSARALSIRGTAIVTAPHRDPPELGAVLRLRCWPVAGVSSRLHRPRPVSLRRHLMMRPHRAG